MPNLAAVLKDEIRRLARKEIREHVGAIKNASVQYRHDIAELKRVNRELARKVAQLETDQRRGGGTSKAAAAKDGSQVRFSPSWVVGHRTKIGLSQTDYGRLVGVSAVTIYHWEAGNSRPRAKQLAAWGAIKKLGRREALKRLETLG